MWVPTPGCIVLDGKQGLPNADGQVWSTEKEEYRRICQGRKKRNNWNMDNKNGCPLSLAIKTKTLCIFLTSDFPNSASVDSPVFPYPALRIPHFPSHLLPNPYGYERHEDKIPTKFNSIVAALNSWWHTSFSAYVLHHCSRLAKHFSIWSHQKWHLTEWRRSSWNKRIQNF